MALFDDTSTAGLQERFQRDGYLALEGYFSSERIDLLAAEVERLLTERANAVVVDNQATGRRSVWADAENRENRHFKFNDLYLLSETVRELALDPPLANLLGALMGEPVVLCNSLNLHKGSGDHRHIDSLFMTPRTSRALLATWTALEDVHSDAGPLTYFPGSHLIPLHTFSDGSRHAIRSEIPAWHAYIAEQIRERRLEEKTFLAKKGDVFIWHSDLVHSGGAIADMNRTRKSLVCHYFSETDCRANQNALEPQNGHYWMRRLPQPVTTPPEAFKAGRRFPEEIYLERYPDVRNAVQAGSLPSGWAHYEAFGFKEGRGV
jgi:ectoine hydroxylase-related dioxygenase (phytanoyl-CoA dioxygenase family)